MAITILPTGQSALGNFGAGLGQGIQNLVDEQIKELAARREKEKTIKGLVAAGIPQQQAEQIIDASPAIQNQVLKDILQTKQGAQLSANITSQFQQGQQQAPTTPGGGVQPVQVGRTGLGALQAIQQPGTPTGVGAAPGIGELRQPAQQAPTEEAGIPELNIGALTKGLHPENVKFVASEALKERRAAKHDIVQERIAREHDKVMKQRLKIQAARADARSEVEARQLDLKEQSAANKEKRLEEAFNQRKTEFEENQQLKKQGQFLSHNKDLINKTTEQYHTNQKQIRNAEQFLVALEHPEVMTGAEYTLAESLGYLDFVRNPATALAESALRQAATGAGAAFNTSRVTNLDVGLFEKYLGHMTDPKDALKAQTKVRILEMQASEVKYNAMQEALKDPNLRPQDLSFRIDDIAAPKLKELADQSMQVVYDTLGIPNPNQVEDGKTAATPDGKVLVKATVPESANPKAPPSGPGWFDSVKDAANAIGESLASNVVGPAIGGAQKAAAGIRATAGQGRLGEVIEKRAKEYLKPQDYEDFKEHLAEVKERNAGTSELKNLEEHWEKTGITHPAKGIGEDLIRRFSRNAPLALASAFGAGGTAIGNALLRTGLGAGAATAAKKLGAPEWLQDTAEFVATLSGSKLNPLSPKDLIKKGKELEETTWKAVDKVAPTTNIKNTAEFQNEVNNIIRKAEQSLPIRNGVRAKHVRELKRVTKLGTGIKPINAEKALNLKQSFYDSAFESSGVSPQASKLYKKMAKALDAKLKEGPREFSIPYTIGNDLTSTFKDMPKWLETYGPLINKYVSPAAIGLLVGAGKIPHAGKLALGAGATVAATKVYELYKLYQSPTIRRLATEIATRLPYETPDVLAPLLKRFNKAVKTEERKK
jgi:hypothetical protein